MIQPPRDNLVRASAGGFELRASGEGMPTIFGHGAVFNQWTKIDSAYEGRFMERIAPGAFRKTIAENRSNMRMLFNHGQDPQIGDKPVAPIETLEEDATGLAYSGRMLDTSYNRDLIPGLEAGLYGSSFRFRVVKEDFNQRAKVSEYNPDGLPERTIQEAAVMEFGPVTFPAYPQAGAGLRSMTDSFVLQQLAADPDRLAQLVASITPEDRSLADVATALLADKGALQGAVDKLGQGENLTKAEAELLDAAIDQLEPPTCCACCQPGCLCCGWECQGEACCAITNAQPAETPEMNSAPKSGAERAHSAEPATATPLVPTHPQAPKEKHVSALNAEERASRMTELDSAIRDVAESYTGALPADVEVTYQTNKQELADLERDESAYQARKADLAHLGTRTSGTETRTEVSWGANPPNVIKRPENIYDMAEIEKRGRSPEERGQMYRDNAMRAVEATSWANPKTDIPTTENKIARLLDHADGPDKEFARRILATGDPVYVRAFNKLVKSHGNTAVLTPEEQRGTAITIGGTGQYLVPFAFDPTVIAIGAHNINPYRANCRVVEVVGASIWHALTSTAAVAVRGVENLVAAEQGPTFAQPSFTPSTVKAQITYSAEAVQDRPDLGSDLAVLLGEAKDNEEENTYSIGTGATTMLGVVGMAPATGTSGAFTALTTITGGGATVAIADLYALEMAVPMRWRPDAGWFMARQTIRKFQGFETTSGILFNATQTMGANYPAVGNPNLTPTGETGLKLLGYPVYEAPSIPVATGANAAICTLAARHQFVMVDRIGMEVQFIPWIQTAGTIYVAGQQALFAIWRNGGGPMQADAGRVLRYLT